MQFSLQKNLVSLLVKEVQNGGAKQLFVRLTHRIIVRVKQFSMLLYKFIESDEDIYKYCLILHVLLYTFDSGFQLLYS